MKFLCEDFQTLEHEQDSQTDRQRNATERITTAAFVGGNKTLFLHLHHVENCTIARRSDG